MAENQLTHIESMTNVQLRAELKQRGCPTSGNKKDLIAKLHAALQKEYEQSSINQSSINHSAECSQSETQVIHKTIPVNDQTTSQYSSTHDLSVSQNVHSSSAVMIPVLQQLSVASSIEHKQHSSITIPDVDVKSNISRRHTRARSKNTSIDNSISTTTSIQEVINSVQGALDSSINDNKVEINSFVSKSIEEEKKDLDNLGGESYLTSVGSNSAKSGSIIKEIPFSDEQQRLNQTKSEEQHDDQTVTIDEEQISASSITNDDIKKKDESINQSSTINLSADLKTITTEQQEIIQENESSSLNKSIERASSEQEVKQDRSQTSSLMKGLHRSTNNKINLSSETLKTLISDISLAPESLINDELDALIKEQSNDDNSEPLINESVIDTIIDNTLLRTDSMTIGELADRKQPTNRTVVMNIGIGSLSSNDELVERKKSNTISTYISSFESRTTIDGKTNTIMTDEPVRIKDVTMTNEPPSQILYIRGLTRPFSLLQLKGLLSRYGTLIDGEFWLDKIKSQCFVIYNTVKEAQNAREALDGCRWPSTNPKTLSVRFGQRIEFEFSKTYDLSPDQMSIDSMDHVIRNKSNEISSRRSPTPVKDMKSSTKNDHSNIREWDILKSQKEKQDEYFIVEEKEPVQKSNESPVKGLDDYFRKTKAKPSIYWLPLTEDDIIERTHREEQRNAKREEERKKREQDENNQSSNSKAYYQSSSTREKRKRSSPLSEQHSKRH